MVGPGGVARPGGGGGGGGGAGLGGGGGGGGGGRMGGSDGGDLDHELVEAFGRHRPGEVETLVALAAHTVRLVALCGRLHPFGHHREIEQVGQLDHFGGDGVAGQVVHQVSREDA